MAQMSGGGGGKYYPPTPSVQAPYIGPPVTAGIGGITATPKKATYSAPRAGTGYASKQTGTNSYGNVATMAASPAVTPQPTPMSMDDFVAQDTSYQSQLAQLAKAFTDYQAQQDTSKNQYLTSYGTDRDTLERNRTNAMSELENDFASRGLLQSGLYADNRADLTNDYNRRNTTLEQAKAQYLAGLTTDLSNYQSEQDLTKQRALQEAAARRAAQYGI